MEATISKEIHDAIMLVHLDSVFGSDNREEVQKANIKVMEFLIDVKVKK